MGYRKTRQPSAAHLLALLLLAGCDNPAGVAGAAGQDPAAHPQWNMQTHEIAVSGERHPLESPGFLEPELLAAGMKQPRILHFSGERLFIGSRGGFIYQTDPPYTKVNALARLDDYPHSVVVRGDEIFVARTSGVYKAPYRPDARWIAQDQFQRVVELPGGGGHSSRTLKMDREGRLYVGVGIRGNCSDEFLDPDYPFERRRGGIYRLDETTSPARLVVHASGLRNPIGFGWHPGSGHIYATNNGPDHLGFEQPPEYFSRLDEQSFHGMPWYQYDGETVYRDDCVGSTPPYPMHQVSVPVATFPARSAPMDVAFYPEQGEVTELAGHAIVAIRGSWGTANGGSAMGDPASRRHPALVLVEFADGEATGRTFKLAGGFQNENGRRWARPVGVAVGPDGAVYFTSDSGVTGLFRLKPRKAAQ